MNFNFENKYLLVLSKIFLLSILIIIKLIQSIVEKRNRETKFLEAETIKIQHKLDELIRSYKKPAIYNANEKWKTPDHSSDTEAVAAAFVAATKNGEACSHQTQFVQDRRLSDSFEFAVSNKFVSEEKSCEKSGNLFGYFFINY